MKKKNGPKHASVDSSFVSRKPWTLLKSQSRNDEGALKRLSPARIIIVVALIIALAGGVFFVLQSGAGLFNISQGVAATINGKQLGEKPVSDYIAKFRATNHLESDDAWGSWLATSGRTPADVRNEVIDFYVDQILYEQIAEERGISISSTELDDNLNQIKAEFGDSDAFQQALESNGYTEEEYREDVLRPALLQERVQASVEAELQAASGASVESSADNGSGAGDESNAEGGTSSESSNGTSQTQQSQARQQFQEWFNDYKSKQDIVKNDMPRHVPYNIDVTAYQQNVTEEQQDGDEG